MVQQFDQSNKAEPHSSTEQLHEELEPLLDGLAGPNDHLGDLREALAAARQIGIAVGMIMAAGRMTEDAALTLLRRMSRTQNRRIREVADDIVQAGHVLV